MIFFFAFSVVGHFLSHGYPPLVHPQHKRTHSLIH